MDRPPFSFRLESVRSLRAHTEEQAREQLARELGHRLRGEALLQEAGRAAGDARAASRSTVLRAGATVHDLIAAQAYVERTQRDCQTAALELDRRDAEVQARRDALVAAAREREAIENVERRKRAQHDAECARIAQIALDEIALAVHRRDRRAA